MKRFGNFKMLCITVMGTVLFNSNAFSQCPPPAIPKIGKNVMAFVPKGWQVKDTITGDFNGDKMEDVVVVLINKKEEDEDDFDYACSRPLLILQKTKTGYTLSAHSNKAVLCKRCGGVFGDPYDMISLNKNVLNIHHYGGSSWKWTQGYTFRFQNNRWELIGVSHDSFWSLGECENGIGDAGRNLSEVNFSTSKMHIIRTNDRECKPEKDIWMTFKRKPLITLQQFDVEKDYFPIKNKN